jgi:hypothetical protein
LRTEVKDGPHVSDARHQCPDPTGQIHQLTYTVHNAQIIARVTQGMHTE